MFTGIVEALGEVVRTERHGDSGTLVVRAPGIAREAAHGASIAVNGVCLTVVGSDPVAGHTEFDVMGETLKRSGIGELRPGERVNLERAVRADSRLDGHIVQGHVDGTGVVLARTPATEWETVRFGLPPDLSRFVAEKGSIAVDGVSLTVTAVGAERHLVERAEYADWFEVGLIPETLRATVLGARQPGDPVNLEVDALAKYVARLLSAGER